MKHLYSLLKLKQTPDFYKLINSKTKNHRQLPYYKPLIMPISQSLFPGPVDIIGDVHGEYEGLLQLLKHLKYFIDVENGVFNHPENRKLVFVGDLVDRGPDSIGVVKLVQSLCENKVAQCILGNHELNLLLNKKKHGNRWFFGEKEVICKDGVSHTDQNVIQNSDPSSDNLRHSFLSFFRSLPLILEREDLIVIHACYSVPHIREIVELEKNRSSEIDIVELHDYYETQTKHKLLSLKINNTVEQGLLLQNENPIKVCTSGLEERVQQEYFAGGRVRIVDRVKWWEDENIFLDPTFGLDRVTASSTAPRSVLPRIVFGHYWRRDLNNIDEKLYEHHPQGFEPTGRDMFSEYNTNQWLGKHQNLFCIDFAAGVRYEERGMGLRIGGLGTNLAALRLPENLIVLDNGSEVFCRI